MTAYLKPPNKTPTFSALGKTGPSSPAVKLKVCDDNNACSEPDQATVNITNVAPDPGTLTVSTNPIITNSSTQHRPHLLIRQDH